MPLFAAIAWLIGVALTEPVGRRAAWAGGALAGLAAAAQAAAGPVAMSWLGDFGPAIWAVLAGALILASAGAGLWLLLRGARTRAAAAAIAPAAVAHVILFSLFLPDLRPLWLSTRAAKAVAALGLSPALGVTPGPVTVAGYAEPSLVFLLSADTRFGDGGAAAEAVAEGRPAIVEARQDAAFQSALARLGARASRAGEGAGLDYSNGRRDLLRIYRPAVGRAQP